MRIGLILVALVLGSVVVRAASAQVPPGAKVVLVTGSTDGLGREVAQRLGAAGAHVIVHGRNRERGEAVVKEIVDGGKGSAWFYAADLSTVKAVKEFAAVISRDYPRIDVLVNNAGIWLSDNRRQVSADGVEIHFAVNYLAPYVLTRALLPRMGGERAPASDAPTAGNNPRVSGPRIINVASGAQNALDFDDLQLTRNYSDSRGYATSKLALVMFTFDLAEELRGKGVLVYTLHPATLMPTTMVKEHEIAAQSTIAEGAEAVMNLVTAPGLASGEYFVGMRAGRANAQAYDVGARGKLKEATERLVEGK